MGDPEALESGLEAVSVRAGSHHSDHYRGVVLQPAVAHHRILLVIERIEDLDRFQIEKKRDVLVLLVFIIVL